jgi:hypothetical protein
MSFCGCKQSKAQKPSDSQAVSPSEPKFTPKLMSIGLDTEYIKTLSSKTTDKEESHESIVLPIEGSEPLTNLERTIKKKSKGKLNIHRMIEDMKK